MKHTLLLTDWHPVSTNVLMNAHWTSRRKLKTFDSDMVRIRAMQQDIPRASGKRRVTITLTCTHPRHMLDGDNVLKSFLDSLVTAGLLVDDAAQYVEVMPVSVVLGKSKQTEVVLEDLETE